MRVKEAEPKPAEAGVDFGEQFIRGSLTSILVCLSCPQLGSAVGFRVPLLVAFRALWGTTVILPHCPIFYATSWIVNETWHPEGLQNPSTFSPFSSGVDVLFTHSVVSDSLQSLVQNRAPLSMGFSRQEYWRGLPFPSPGNFLDPGIESGSLAFLKILYHLSYQGSPYSDLIDEGNTHPMEISVLGSLKATAVFFT